MKTTILNLNIGDKFQVEGKPETTYMRISSLDFCNPKFGTVVDLSNGKSDRLHQDTIVIRV